MVGKVQNETPRNYNYLQTWIFQAQKAERLLWNCFKLSSFQKRDLKQSCIISCVHIFLFSMCSCYLLKNFQYWDLCLWSVMGKKRTSTCLVTNSHRSRNRKEEDCHTKPNYAGSNVLHLPLDTCEQTATNLKKKISTFRTISFLSPHLAGKLQKRTS